MTVWFILDNSHKISRYYHRKVKGDIRDSTEISMLELESWIFSGVFLSSMVQRRLPAFQIVPSFLMRYVVRLPPRRPGFEINAVHVGFVGNKTPIGQVSVRVLQFFIVSVSYSFVHRLLTPSNYKRH
jgi:hypothetical protein